MWFESTCLTKIINNKQINNVMSTVKKVAVKKVAVKEVKVSEYKTFVLSQNSLLKEESRTVGGAIKIVLILEKLEPSIRKALKAIQKDDVLFKQFKAKITKTEGGKTSPFRVFQLVYKMRKEEEQFDKKFNINNLKK